MKCPWFCKILCLLVALSWAGPVAARTIRVCINDRSAPPYTYPDREGLGQELLRKAIEQQGDTMVVTPLPWRRCLESVRAGENEVPLMGSPSEFVRGLADFPMKGGEPDESRAISSANLVVFVRKDGGVTWDGQAFGGLSTPVAYGSGIAVVREKLERLGVTGEEGLNLHEQIGKLLFYRKVQAGVVRETVAKTLLHDNPDFRPVLQILPVPFLVDNSYAPFNKAFAQANPAYVEAVWNAIGAQRARPEWARRERAAVEAIIEGRER